MAAAQHVLPVFSVRALGIIEKEVIIVPGLEIALAVPGALLRGIAPVADFAYVSFPSLGTWDSHFF